MTKRTQITYKKMIIKALATLPNMTLLSCDALRRQVKKIASHFKYDMNLFLYNFKKTIADLHKCKAIVKRKNCFRLCKALHKRFAKKVISNKTSSLVNKTAKRTTPTKRIAINKVKILKNRREVNAIRKSCNIRTTLNSTKGSYMLRNILN